MESINYETLNQVQGDKTVLMRHSPRGRAREILISNWQTEGFHNILLLNADFGIRIAE